MCRSENPAFSIIDRKLAQQDEDRSDDSACLADICDGTHGKGHTHECSLSECRWCGAPLCGENPDQRFSGHESWETICEECHDKLQAYEGGH